MAPQLDETLKFYDNNAQPLTEVKNSSGTDFVFRKPASRTRKRKGTAAAGQKSDRDIKKTSIMRDEKIDPDLQETFKLYNSDVQPLTDLKNRSETDSVSKIPASPTRERKDTADDDQKNSRDMEKMLITLKEKIDPDLEETFKSYDSNDQPLTEMENNSEMNFKRKRTDTAARGQKSNRDIKKTSITPEEKIDPDLQETLKLYNNNDQPLIELKNRSETDSVSKIPASPTRKGTADDDQKSSRDMEKMLITLKEQIAAVLESKPACIETSSADENTDPLSQPFLWVSKWIDYSGKYGFGYQLSDDSVGVMYNDGTHLIMLANKFNILYITDDDTELYYTVQNYPIDLETKMKVFNIFLQYMNADSMKADDSVAVTSSDSMSRIPYMHLWFRTQTAVTMHRANGSVQINFFDNTKIIMCPLMAAVTYIDQKNNFRTYRFESIKRNGCIADLAKKLKYAHEKIGIIINNFTEESQSDNETESCIKRARPNYPS